MAGFVAAAVVGGAVISGVASSKAASSQSKAAREAAETQSEAAVRVAEIETQAAREAAEIQAEAFRQAAAAQEAGLRRAAGVEEGALTRAPGPITQAELGQFNQAVATGRFDDAARIAAATGVAPETVTQYINANLAGLNLPEQVTQENVAELMSRAQVESGGIRGAGEITARASEQAAQQQAEAQLAAAQQQAEAAQREYADLAQAFEETGSQQSAAALEAARVRLQASQAQAQQARNTYAEQTRLLGPFQQAGVSALGRIEAGLAPGGEFAQPFTAERFQADPGYAFRLSEGQQALERQSAARGGLMSGAALKAATRFGQEMGSQEFQRAFDRYYNERAAVLNPLGQLMTTGYGASSQLFGGAGTMGANIANALGAGGEAQATGILGSANALAAGRMGGQQARTTGGLTAADALAAGRTSAAASRAQGILGAGAARGSSYLDQLQARAQTERDLAAVRASAYTGPAQFAAQGVLGAGRATAGGLQQAATATSQGLLQAGQARAAGQLGVANALTGALNTGVNLYQQNQLLNRLYPTGGVNLPTNNTYLGNFPSFSFV
jgi:chemotaxis protein histidine kinase CheA